MKSYKRIIIGVMCLLLMPSVTAMAESQAISSISITTGNGQETPVYKYGEQKDLVINVKNVGTIEANNVRITPKLEANTDGWPFEIASMNYDQDLGKIGSGEEKKVQYNFKSRQDVADKYYKLGFTITYDDGTKAYSTEKNIFVKMEGKGEAAPTPTPTPTPDLGVSNEPSGILNGEPSMIGGGSSAGGSAPSSSVPRVIVTGFNTEPGDVKAGSNFRLIIHLKNTSATTAVKNMLFNFSAPTEGKDETTAPAFLPVSGSSSVYVDAIGAEGNMDIAIDMNAKADLVQKPYSMEVAMQYEDQSGTQFQSNAHVSIPVKQDPRFEFSEFEINPSPVSVGEEANIMCNLYNLGRSKLYNVKVKFEGKSITSKEGFIGNVESGATAAIDAMIKAEKETAQGEKIKMIMTYEDDAGKITTVEKEVAFEVGPVMEDANVAMMMPEDVKSKLPILPIALGVVAVVAIIIVIVLKRKKRREEVFEDELVGLIEDEQ